MICTLRGPCAACVQRDAKLGDHRSIKPCCRPGRSLRLEDAARGGRLMSKPSTIALARLLATLSLGALTLALWPALAQAQAQAPTPTPTPTPTPAPASPPPGQQPPAQPPPENGAPQKPAPAKPA